MVVAEAALARLARYSWPGNVRELRNTVERALVLHADKIVLQPGDFDLGGLVSAADPSARQSWDYKREKDRALERWQLEFLEAAFSEVGGAVNFPNGAAIARVAKLTGLTTKGVRDILTSASKDILHFPKPQWLDYSGASPEHLYTNQIQPYYRAPHIFLGFPMRYNDRKWSEPTFDLPGLDERLARAKSHPRYGTAVTDALLISSRDGVKFRRTVALIGTNLVVFLDQVESAEGHVYDLAYHNRGRLQVLPELRGHRRLRRRLEERGSERVPSAGRPQRRCDVDQEFPRHGSLKDYVARRLLQPVQQPGGRAQPARLPPHPPARGARARPGARLQGRALPHVHD